MKFNKPMPQSNIYSNRCLCAVQFDLVTGLLPRGAISLSSSGTTELNQINSNLLFCFIQVPWQRRETLATAITQHRRPPTIFRDRNIYAHPWFLTQPSRAAVKCGTLATVSIRVQPLPRIFTLVTDGKRNISKRDYSSL